MTLRVMFDSNAYDQILRHGDVGRIEELISERALRIITTHIQEDELLQIPDKDHQSVLLNIYRRICVKPAPTSIGMWDISRWDQFKWAGEEEKKSFSEIQRNKSIASRDEIIGLTAKDQCDVFVSQDRGFRNRLIEAAPQLCVLTYADFRRTYLE